jgi:calcium-dependent protein kinase
MTMGMVALTTTHRNVYLQFDRRLQRRVVCKILPVCNESDNEIRILKQLNGKQNIIELLGVETDINGNYNIVMEYCKNGSLQEYYTKECVNLCDATYETTMRDLIKECLLSILSCHDNYIIHGDIKMENYVIDKSVDYDGCVDVKLIDFGCGKQVESCNDMVTYKRATPYYMAPEMLSCSKIHMKSDIWALGVMTYYLIYQRFPYTTNIEITNGLYDCTFDRKYTIAYTIDCSDFMRRLLNKDLKQRLTADQALDHIWMCS